MQRRALILALLSLLGCIVVACGEDNPEHPEPGTSTSETRTHGLTEAEASQVLAKIGDREITVGEFAESIASKGPFLRTRYNAPERRRELLDQMVRFELLAQEADTRGLDDLPDVQRARKQVLIRRFLKQEFEDRIQLTDIADADVEAYYNAHLDEFNKPEQVRASQIVIADQATAQRVLRQILQNPSDMRLFRQLAEQHNSDPATRDRFGDMGFFSRPAERQTGEPTVATEVADAIFALDTIGAVHTELVRAPDGFHIVKITGRRAPLHRTLEEAARPIRHRLWRERRETAVEEMVTRLRAEADVQEDLSLLDQVHIEVPEGNYAEVIPDDMAGDEHQANDPSAVVPAPAPVTSPTGAPSPSGTGMR